MIDVIVKAKMRGQTWLHKLTWKERGRGCGWEWRWRKWGKNGAVEECCSKWLWFWSCWNVENFHLSMPLSPSVQLSDRGGGTGERGNLEAELSAVGIVLHACRWHDPMCRWWILEVKMSKNVLHYVTVWLWCGKVWGLRRCLIVGNTGVHVGAEKPAKHLLHSKHTGDPDVITLDVSAVDCYY